MTEFYHELLCRNLPSRPLPEAGKILVTGATGYIGGRLIPELIGRGYQVVAMVRHDADAYRERWPGATVVEGDALDRESLKKALEGISTAYYLIHSLRLGEKHFEEADITAAKNFSEAAAASEISRIIYLGGLGDAQMPLSPHLKSRFTTGVALMDGPTPVTVLRTAIIIGSGSASFEIIKHLVRNLPLILLPPWAFTLCQPIAIRDVLKYLVGALETPSTTGEFFDIGGPDILMYADILKVFAEILGRKTLFLRVPFITSCRLFGYLAGLITPVPAPLVMALMAGCKDEVICKDSRMRDLLPFEPLPLREAVARALAREERAQVFTRWSDSRSHTSATFVRLAELRKPPRFSLKKSLVSSKSASSLFETMCNLGGDEGWFHTTILWKVRGVIDRAMLGVGIARGRKCSPGLSINDVIDCWRVEDLRENEMLLLRGEMKLPGRGWLKLMIEPLEGKNRLELTAFFDTDSFWGPLYWIILLPFHHLIFMDILREIENWS
ncbi:MAG: DUF2867 domain-containing protein [Candidatus Eremiobacteraeota bacterium]|nr:DUF2867 domain-containing protein [Candidatus Eremiobacteraeota bacterium]